MNDKEFEKLTFEQAIEMLEDVVNKLNQSSTSLDDALELFEKGTKLTSICKNKLNEAKIKITELEK